MWALYSFKLLHYSRFMPSLIICLFTLQGQYMFQLALPLIKWKNQDMLWIEQRNQWEFWFLPWLFPIVFLLFIVSNILLKLGLQLLSLIFFTIANSIAMWWQSKWLVSALFGAIIIWKHDAEVMWAAMGAVTNSYLSITLKRILNQQRPVPTLRSDPGMPSSHAQSIFYAVIFAIVSCKPTNYFSLTKLRVIFMNLVVLC